MTTQEMINETTEQLTPRCPHYWVIQPADGPVSRGACQICGEEKEFKNYVEASTWGDERLSSRNRAPAVAAVRDYARPPRDENDEE